MKGRTLERVSSWQDGERAPSLSLAETNPSAYGFQMKHRTHGYTWMSDGWQYCLISVGTRYCKGPIDAKHVFVVQLKFTCNWVSRGFYLLNPATLPWASHWFHKWKIQAQTSSKTTTTTTRQKQEGTIFIWGDSLYGLGLYLTSVSFDFSIKEQLEAENTCL